MGRIVEAFNQALAGGEISADLRVSCPAPRSTATGTGAQASNTARKDPAEMLITRRLEFDAGHRIPNHASQCRHLHGHRYALEITLSGEIFRTEGAAEQGMVMDFSEVKDIANRVLVDRWDHAFLVYQGDRAVVEFLASLPAHKTIVLPVVPPRKTSPPRRSTSSTRPISTPIATSSGCSACACMKRQNWADAVR